MKEFGDIEVEGFKRTGGKKKFRTRKLIKIEEMVLKQQLIL